MNSAEAQMIKKLMTSQIEKQDIQDFINLKKNLIQAIKTKNETPYNTHVKKYCISTFDDRKNELIEQYHYFSNLYEYLKLQNLQDSQKILDIINNIENELLINL